MSRLLEQPVFCLLNELETIVLPGRTGVFLSNDASLAHIAFFVVRQVDFHNGIFE
jgi:hypothetical protein